MNLWNAPIGKELAAIYRQEIIQDIMPFASQRAANFYDMLFICLDFTPPRASAVSRGKSCCVRSSSWNARASALRILQRRKIRLPLGIRPSPLISPKSRLRASTTMLRPLTRQKSWFDRSTLWRSPDSHTAQPHTSFSLIYLGERTTRWLLRCTLFDPSTFFGLFTHLLLDF